MFTDGSSFYHRALLFDQELRNNTYPNATLLSELARCSRNTAQRTIDRLRKEFLFPFEYDAGEHGYYLTDRNYTFPKLPPGREELTALLLVRELAKIIDDTRLHEAIEKLWQEYSAGNTNGAGELSELVARFSSDLTEIGILTDLNLLDLVRAAATGALATIRYTSPWQGKEKEHQGRILRVHFKDGNLYLLFDGEKEKPYTLNASFISAFSCDEADCSPADTPSPWPEGFGIFTGAEKEEIEIAITAPASAYFSRQLWHRDQEDTWESDTLIRKLPSVIAPEIVRRILSLGACVQYVKPEPLRALVESEAQAIAQQLQGEKAFE